MENCKVCKESDCTGDSVEIIQNACSDSTQEGFQTDFSKKTVLANQIATKMSDGQNSLRSAFEEKRFFEILFSSQKYRVKTVCK